MPLRAELGPRDLEAGHTLVAHRIGELDDKGRPVKQTIPLDELATRVPQLLDDYHDALVARAVAFRDEHTAVVDDWDAFVAQVATGWAEVLHCGRPACEDDIKAETAATPRCILMEGEDETGACIRCGEPSAYGTRVLFGRAY